MRASQEKIFFEKKGLLEVTWHHGMWHAAIRRMYIYIYANVNRAQEKNHSCACNAIPDAWGCRLAPKRAKEWTLPRASSSFKPQLGEVDRATDLFGVLLLKVWLANGHSPSYGPISFVLPLLLQLGYSWYRLPFLLLGGCFMTNLGAPRSSYWTFPFCSKDIGSQLLAVHGRHAGADHGMTRMLPQAAAHSGPDSIACFFKSIHSVSTHTSWMMLRRFHGNTF